MNCNPGDIARIVTPQKQLAELRDRIVRVVQLCDINGEPSWELEKREEFVMVGAGRSTITGETFGIGTPVYLSRLQDKYLRPIRPGDGDDETLTWRSVPDPVHEVIGEAARLWAPKPQVEHSR